jgi:hypothetical protein
LRTNPSRVAGAVSFVVALGDAGDGFAPAFKQTMAARLNGASASRCTLTRICQPYGFKPGFQHKEFDRV